MTPGWCYSELTNEEITMKLLLQLLTCFGIAAVITSCCTLQPDCSKKNKCSPCSVQTEEHVTVETIDTAEMEKVSKDGSALILDARSEKYDDGRRIPGAKSLTDKSTAEEVAKVIKEKDQKIVTYCSSPTCPASARLAKHLKKLGYTNIREYPKGIKGWVKEGKKVEQAK